MMISLFVDAMFFSRTALDLLKNPKADFSAWFGLEDNDETKMCIRFEICKHRGKCIDIIAQKDVCFRNLHSFCNKTL